MTKYIKVDWPESQKFIDYRECYIAIPNDPTDYEPSGNTYMVPENLYNKVMYKLQFPKKYENTNLGTIVCYENRAVVNGNETFWYDKSTLKRGSTVLVYNHDLDKWIITTCISCSFNMPVLVKDKDCIIGINSKLIGILSENDQM